MFCNVGDGISTGALYGVAGTIAGMFDGGN
jgi:hypothetical protein